jgi:type II secretory pathway pseudopilin PulG
MKFKPTTPRAFGVSQRGFTLAEALAALAFLAIVLPVAVGGLRVANTAGVVAERKTAAARVADRVLSELIVTGQWKQSSSGVAEEGNQRFRWQLQNKSWDKDPFKLLTLQVSFAVQGQDHDVNISTVIDGTQ